LASRCGGAAEIIGDGVTGILFEPAKPEDGLAGLRRLLEEEDLRRRLGVAARAKYEREFTIAAMVDGYHDFWSGIPVR
jgi:glycosyltransferase involved in cell wall biosynthesis